jgi:hypothetical protein
MAIIGSTQFLERIQFFNGERLFASDLQGLEAFNREMRWLHNQSLHQCGVGSGFQVVGNVGDRQVTISPGYAIDSCGREIILTENQVLAIPPVSDNGSGGSVFYDLTVSYPSDSELTPSETRDGICMPTGVVRLREEPVFCWVRLSDDPTNRQPQDLRLKQRITTGLFIVLAQAEIFNCQLRQPVSTAPRRNARPPKLPRVGCGLQTGGTAWVGPNPAAPTASTLGVTFAGSYYTLPVVTTSAGFQAVPAYVARLAGSREFTTAATAGAAAGSPFLVDALINIVSDTTLTATGFTLQIFPFYAVLDGSTTGPAITDVTTAVQQWNVSWLGIES